MQDFKQLLAPYGSLQFFELSAKVGKVSDHPASLLAPYGTLDLLKLSSKVGKGGV